MKVIKTPFEELVVIEPSVYKDERGYFFESYNEKAFENAGLKTLFVQDNQSRSKKGVLRGLHFQRPPHAQVKLVRVLSGVILDVVVDLRNGQTTFGKHFLIEISSDNKKQLLIPGGFAHGFLVLSDEAEVLYKCDKFYSPQSEGGLRYDDPKVGINWSQYERNPILNQKDLALPLLEEMAVMF